VKKKPFTNERYTDFGTIKSLEFVDYRVPDEACIDIYYNIKTDKTYLTKFDVTNFPKPLPKEGDKIGIKDQWNNKRFQTSYVKNGVAKPYSTCYSWMPAYKKEVPKD
jgi:hypothetical protein